MEHEQILNQKTRRERGIRKHRRKDANRKYDLNPNILVILLNINDSNTPIEVVRPDKKSKTKLEAKYISIYL